MLLDVEDCQLVLVDYQDRLMPAIHDAGHVVQQAALLAQSARALGVPVWGTEQNPQGLGPTVAELRAHCQQIFSKTDFDATQSTGLMQALRPAAPRAGGNARSLPKHLQKAPAPVPGRSTVVLAGCEAHICLLQTALGLLEQELDVWVVTDACGSRRERDRDAAFDRLAGNGVELVTTEMVLFEWLQSSDHPQFKDIQAWLK